MKRILFRIALSCAAIGQTKPQFEVASIKPSASTIPGGQIQWNAGSLRVTNMTLKELVQQAWDVQDFQVAGAAGWIDSTRFNISAKPSARTTNWKENAPLLQSLLADRFQLVVRRETREMPVYALVLARKDGKLGPQMIESKEGSCETYDAEHPMPRPQPGKPVAPGCGMITQRMGQIRTAAFPVENLAGPLAGLVGRTVIDKTGLTGRFDMVVDYTADDYQLAQWPAGVPRPEFATGGPALFTALQEQLGLKLESQKGPVEVLVIEKAEKPSEN
jgi:uncharacterized protein (TIGR03435 family)